MLELTLTDYLHRLASADPTPGGGSVAALCGALAGGLGAMVCRLTFGKPRYADVEAELQQVVVDLDELRVQLTGLVAEDARAYDELSAAYKVPKDDPGREAAIQAALVIATETPLRIAELAAQVVDLVPVVVAKGSKVAVSDAGMAALLSAAALRSAALNVLINVKATKDEARAAAARARLDAALAGRVERAEALYAEVVARVGG